MASGARKRGQFRARRCFQAHKAVCTYQHRDALARSEGGACHAVSVVVVIKVVHDNRECGLDYWRGSDSINQGKFEGDLGFLGLSFVNIQIQAPIVEPIECVVVIQIRGFGGDHHADLLSVCIVANPIQTNFLRTCISSIQVVHRNGSSREIDAALTWKSMRALSGSKLRPRDRGRTRHDGDESGAQHGSVCSFLVLCVAARCFSFEFQSLLQGIK